MACRPHFGTATAACERDRALRSLLQFLFRVFLFRTLRLISDGDLCCTLPPPWAFLMLPLLMMLLFLRLFRAVSCTCVLPLILRDVSPARLLRTARALLLSLSLIHI